MDTEVPQCMARTTKGHRCKLNGGYTSDCYGVQTSVCKRHAGQNAIHQWSRFTYNEHVPSIIKQYLDFYEKCVYTHGFRKIPSISITTELFRDMPVESEPDDIVVNFMQKTMSHEPGEETDCAICMDNPPGNMCSLHCNHKFCYPCIMNWVFTNPTCPLCRKNISRSIKPNES
ncbi:MAG: hypothetical protein CMA70_03340 [Euryarchaeota archaeon]|jgi:hypothetical protein|nr:hypothetical protein [Euryarchaeota archaeon]